MRRSFPISEFMLSVTAWVSLGTTACGLLFMLAYTVLAKWWRSGMGTLMMAFAFIITFLMGYTFMIIKVIPDSTVARWVRIVGSGLIGLLFVFQTLLMVRAQLERRQEQKEEVR